jgi:hypothetical protein
MTKHIKVNGAVTYWTLSDGLSLDTLRDKCPSWFGALLPKEMGALGSLRRVLAARIHNKAGMYLRPVKREGYAIMQEEELAGVKSAVEKGRVCLLRLPNGDMGLHMQPFHQEVFHSIVRAWTEERRRITAGALGTALSQAAVGRRVKGVSLRPTGGVYWVADTTEGAWEAVANGIEASGDCKVYRMRVAHDAESVRAILDNLTSHVEKEMGGVNEALASGEIGKRAKKTQHKRAQGLEELVSHVEKSLEVTLLSLREKTTALGDVAAVEAFMNL